MHANADPKERSEPIVIFRACLMGASPDMDIPVTTI
jgi:hypothetical protein